MTVKFGYTICFNVLRWNLLIKFPSARPLFSERNGIRKPQLKLGGYRLFIRPRY